MRRPFLACVLIVGLITVAAGAINYTRITRFWGITQTDFSVFWFAGYQVRNHQSFYTYHPTRFTTDDEYLFKYAPPLAVAMAPLSHLPIQTAIRWWYALTALALIGALACLRAALRPTDTPHRDLSVTTYLLILATILRPYLATLRLGQVDAILAGCLVAFLLALHRGRDAVAGGLLAIPILCKVAPAVWLGYLAATRRWRALVWTILAMGVLLASPVPFLGIHGTWQAMREWVGVLHTSGGRLEWLVRYKNQSLLSVILRVLTGGHAAAITPTFLAVAAGITMALGVLYGWGVWRVIRRAHDTRDPRRELIAAGLVMIAMIIFSPHAWIATYIHLLVPYAILVTTLVTKSSADPSGWWWLAGSFILVSVTAPDALLGGRLSALVHLASPMTWGALLLAAGLWRTQRLAVR